MKQVFTLLSNQNRGVIDNIQTYYVSKRFAGCKGKRLGDMGVDPGLNGFGATEAEPCLSRPRILTTGHSPFRIRAIIEWSGTIPVADPQLGLRWRQGWGLNYLESTSVHCLCSAPTSQLRSRLYETTGK